MRLTQLNPTQNKDTKLVYLFLMFILFCNFSFSQSQPIKLSWTGEVGCQQYDEEEEPKDPRESIFIEDISDSECYRFCENNSANYTLTFLPAGSTVTWSVIGGTIIYNNPSNTSCLVLWGDAGNGSITVNISTNNGIITKSLCVEKINTPVAQFSVNNVITPNGETAFACTQQMLYFSNLTDTNNGTALVSFLWDFGDGTTSTAENPTHTYTTDQEYPVTLTVTNACNCTSTYEMFVDVKGRGFNITCPSVVCENQTEIYSLPFDEKDICEDAASNWSVIGGTIVSQGGGNVAVNWDNADGGLNATGFGYVTFNPTNCSIDCMEPTTIKVPVIMQNGNIAGKTTICAGEQERYSLPQWPTTEIVWSIVNDPNETTASIIQTDQRNEIIVTPANGFTGTIILRAVYKNTLLNCGGEAEITINVSNPANIYGEELLCMGTTGNYSDSNGNGYINFELYNSNNNLVATSLNTLQYTFTTPGDYYVVASGQNICETRKNIKVIANPRKPEGIDGAIEVCPNVPETFSVQNPDPNSTYIWAITNGTIVGSNTGTTVTATFNGTAPGNISVVRQTVNPISCSSSAVNKTVNIKTVTAQISGTLNVCANSVSDFEIQNPNNTLFIDPEVTYEWSLSNPLLGSISNGQGTNQIQVTWNNTTSPQTCDVLVAIKKCTLPEVFTTTVTVQPAPTISIAPATQTICAGQSASFTINSSIPLAVGTQVQWTFGGVTQTGGLTHTFVFSNNTANITSKTVTAIILNPNGCDGTATNLATAEIDVKPQPGATLSLSSSFGNVFCTKFQINAQVTIASSITGVTIQWYHEATNGTLTALPFSGNVMPLTSGFGAYYFTATNSFGCTKDSNKIYIIQNCDGEPPTCTIPNNPQVINNATNSCGVLQLNGIAAPNPINTYWTIIGPQNAINYTLPTLDVVPGLYNVFYNANYYCTSGQIGTITKNKQIVVPYKANLSHTVTCSGNNSFAISLIDLSVFYAEVTNQSVQFYYRPSGTTNWILTPPNFNLAAGTYDFKVVNNGLYQGNPQPACEKVIPSVALQSIGNLNITYLPTPNIPCHDTAVKFGVSGIPNPTYTYIWTFDIGTPQEVTNTMTNPFKTFTTPGIHTVNVTVKNPNGCQKILNQITVDIPDPCFAGDITATQNPACANSTVTLSYNNSSDAGCNGIVYQWMKGSTPFATTPTITVQENGLYWLKLESANNCKYEAPTRIPVQFITPPSVQIKGNNTFCEGEFIELTAVTQANTIRWYINNSTTPVSGTNNQTSVSLTTLPVGNHTIKVEVWNSANGCINTVIFPITIVPAPTSVNITINNIDCEPYGVSLSASVPGNPANVSYNWSNGASGSTIWMNEGGPIKVTATVGGCSVSSQMFVPKSPESYLWVFPSGCFDDCIKENGYLVGPTTPFVQWAWNQDGQINNSGNQSFTDPITLFDDGSYSLTLNNGSCEATAAPLDFTTIDCRACPLEIKEIIKIVRADTPFCSYDFSFVLSSNLPITYQAMVTEEANVIFNPSTITILPGNNQYDFNVIPTNNFNGGTIHITIQGTYINPKSGKPTTCIYEFDVEFPPCDGFQAKEIVGNDLESLKNAITLYPNPTQNLVNLQYDLANDNTSVYVYDLSGRMMYSSNITDKKGNLELNTITFEAGIYIVVLKQNNEIIHQQKLIKK